MSEPSETIALLDYRRNTNEIYRPVREDPPGEQTWQAWRSGRDNLFATHSQSALDVVDREDFHGLKYFAYQSDWRLLAKLQPAPRKELSLNHSAEGSTPARRFAQAEFKIHGERLSLGMYWLETYGGGLFLPFRDGTAGNETYGGGRYLLDTVKGADLGQDGDLIVLDFNYAYHPSCVHSDAWSCPLAPPENYLDVRVTAGERL